MLMKKPLRIVFFLVSTLQMCKQYRTDTWTEGRNEEGKKGKKKGKKVGNCKSSVRAQQFCLCRVFNQLHTFLFACRHQLNQLQLLNLHQSNKKLP